MKKISAMAALILFFCITLIVVFFAAQKKPSLKYPVCFGPNCYFAELAVTAAEQQKGLMFRNSMGREEGMLFIFEKEGSRSFWMKNTIIPLDMIWIDKDKKVSYIAAGVQPCKSDHCPLISPLDPAQYVLEVNAGEAERIGLKIGDEVVFPR
jgi:hypothetical protein